MQALHWAWQDNRRLWLLATPAAASAAMEVGAVVDAARAARHPAHPQAGAAWLAGHYEAAQLGLAALNAAALCASTLCLLAAAAGLGAGGGGGEAGEALLGEEGRRRRKPRGGSQRLRLIHGTLKYLVPDTLQLRVR